MKLTIENRLGKQIDTLELPSNATISQLKYLFYEKHHYYPERQRFTIGSAKGVVLEDGTLMENGLQNGVTLVFKDLGVQISWRLVFVIEYLGPLIIFPLFVMLPSVVYGQRGSSTKCLTQKLAFWLAMLHYMKREVETLFIHRFSSVTMPIMRLPINCLHYWVLFATAVGYYLFHPMYVAPIKSSLLNYTLAAAMLFFEFLNFQTHLELRNIRPRGTKVRGVPTGWGFDSVVCANYFWEVCAWLTFSVLVNCLTSWVFLLVAFAQMTQWAFKKRSNYIREFTNYPRNRAAIIPYLL